MTKANKITSDEQMFEGAFENFSIYPASIYVTEIEANEPGYAVKYDGDGVVQIWAASIPVALSFASQGDQMLQMLKAMQEQNAQADDTAGLLADAVDTDTLH